VFVGRLITLKEVGVRLKGISARSLEEGGVLGRLFELAIIKAKG